jgi:hypothetical protein
MPGKLFALTARDQHGDLVEWFVETAPGTLSYFEEEQARAQRTGRFYDVHASEISRPSTPPVSPRVATEPDYFVEDLAFLALGFIRGRL